MKICSKRIKSKCNLHHRTAQVGIRANSLYEILQRVFLIFNFALPFGERCVTVRLYFGTAMHWFVSVEGLVDFVSLFFFMGLTFK